MGDDGGTEEAAANDDGGTGGAAADDDGGTGVRIDQGKDRHAKKTVGETSQVEADENEAIVGEEMKGQVVEEMSGDSVDALSGGGKGRGRGRPVKKGKVGAGELTKKGGRKH